MKTHRKFWRKPLASLLKRFFMITNGGFSVGHAYGTRMLFDWNHSLDKKVAVELYEHAQIQYLLACAAQIQPQVFLDIGAHAALYSLVVKSHFPAIEVHAYEPDRINLCQLYANLFVNRLSKDIQVHEHGISDRAGFAAFETSEANSSRGTRRITESGKEQIPIYPLDDVFAGNGQTLLIKIDVEGHEEAAIRGACKTLGNNMCFLQVESAPTLFAGIKKQLTELGYRHVTTLSDHFFTNIEDFTSPPH